MATLFSTLAIAGARGANGLPVASGFAHFYVRGSTSEYQTIYLDAEETEPLTGPLALDASGRARAYLKNPTDLIIITADGSNTFQFYDATGVDAGLVEVSSAGWTGTTLPGVLTAIAASLGGTDGKYKESTASGCVARTVHDVLDSSISPYDFGAIGDGSADDSLPLQRAINRALAAGAPLYLGEGAFKITTGLTVAGALNIKGNGAGKSKITATSESFNGITVTVPNENLNDGFRWEGFSVLLPYTSGNANRPVVVAAGNNCTFDSMVVSGGGGFDTTYSQRARMVSCVANVKGRSGLVVTAFNLGVLCSAEECLANCNPSSGTVQYTIGFSGKAASNCKSCIATGADKGFYNGGSGTSPALFQTCRTTTCNTGYSVAAETNSIFIGCVGFSSATAEFDNPSAASVTTIDCGWSTPTVPITVSNIDLSTGVATSRGSVNHATGATFSGGVRQVFVTISGISADIGGNGVAQVTLSGIAAMTQIHGVSVTPGRTDASESITTLEAHVTSANVCGFTLVPNVTHDGQTFTAYLTITGV